MIATELDHVSWVARDISIHAEFEALGFRLTPLATQYGILMPGGPLLRFGAANRRAMLRQGYLELLGITDPSLPMNGLDRLADRYEDLHVLAFGMDDPAANLTRLRRGKLPFAGVLTSERPFNDAEPDGPRARFARLTMPDAPEGRMQLLQHLTPGLLWQEPFLAHPNRAIALEAAILAVEHPAETAARLARFAGRPAGPEPAGGYALDLPHGRVRIVPPAALATLLPGISLPVLPFFAAAMVRVEDGGAAIRTILGGAAHEVPGGIMAMVGGGAVVFTA